MHVNACMYVRACTTTVSACGQICAWLGHIVRLLYESCYRAYVRNTVKTTQFLFNSMHILLRGQQFTCHLVMSRPYLFTSIGVLLLLLLLFLLFLFMLLFSFIFACAKQMVFLSDSLLPAELVCLNAGTPTSSMGTTILNHGQKASHWAHALPEQQTLLQTTRAH